MQGVRPIYKKLLIAAVAIYVAGVTIMLSDIYARLGNLEHELSHISAGPGHHR
jgi:hypothetical protein